MKTCLSVKIKINVRKIYQHYGFNNKNIPVIRSKRAEIRAEGKNFPFTALRNSVLLLSGISFKEGLRKNREYIMPPIHTIANSI